jgi:hypothetical protein
LLHLPFAPTHDGEFHGDPDGHTLQVPQAVNQITKCLLLFRSNLEEGHAVGDTLSGRL